MVFNFCQDLFWKKKIQGFSSLFEKSVGGKLISVFFLVKESSELNTGPWSHYSLKKNAPCRVHIHFSRHWTDRSSPFAKDRCTMYVTKPIHETFTKATLVVCVIKQRIRLSLYCVCGCVCAYWLSALGNTRTRTVCNRALTQAV